MTNIRLPRSPDTPFYTFPVKHEARRVSQRAVVVAEPELVGDPRAKCTRPSAFSFRDRG
jgi:hypothetical protein